MRSLGGRRRKKGATATATGSFLTSTWDPVLIVGQIVCMQALFYVSLGLLLLVLDAAAHAPLTLAQLLDPAATQATTAGGEQKRLWWIPIVALFANALVLAGGMVFVVEKARKCLDFACTAYINHVFAAVCYAGVASLASPVWWATLVGAAALSAVVAEFLCMRRELRDIPIGSAARRSVLAV